MYNGKAVAFVLQVSIKRCHHYFQAFRFIIFAVFGFVCVCVSACVCVCFFFLFFQTESQKAMVFAVFLFLELFFSSSIVVAVAIENLLKMPVIISAHNSSVYPNFAQFRGCV